MSDHSVDLIKEISDTYKEILSNSTQAIYFYLDDSHKLCNEKFSSMLGYSSPEEWAAIEENFPDAFVAKGSQETLVDAYQTAMTDYSSSVVKITWKTKAEDTVDTEVVLIPMVYQNHLLAMHFISKTSN